MIHLIDLVVVCVCFGVIGWSMRTISACHRLQRAREHTLFRQSMETIPLGSLGHEVNVRDFDLVPHPSSAEAILTALREEMDRMLLTGDASQTARSLFVDQAYRAQTKADALLVQWLTPEQAAQFESTGTFTVVGEATGQRYKITQEAIFNVHVLVDGCDEEDFRLCFVPAGGLARGDRMLAQKLALETDERSALAVANPDDPYEFETAGLEAGLLPGSYDGCSGDECIRAAVLKG